MRITAIAGVMLVTIGIMSLGYQVIAYKNRETMTDPGQVKISAEKTTPLPLPLIAGTNTLICGIVLLVIGRKKDRTDENEFLSELL